MVEIGVDHVTQKNFLNEKNFFHFSYSSLNFLQFYYNFFFNISINRHLYYKFVKFCQK